MVNGGVKNDHDGRVQLLDSNIVYFWASIGLLSLGGVILWYTDSLTSTSEGIRYVIMVVGWGGLWLTIEQIRAGRRHLLADHDQRLRMHTISTLGNLQTETREATLKLHKEFNYINRGKRPVSVKEVHVRICKLKAGCENKPVDNRTEDDLEVDKNGGVDRKCFFLDTGVGAEVYYALSTLLNNYEFIAVGIDERVFDDRIVKELLRGNIIKAYKVFEQYIEHVCEEMTKSQKTWEHFRTLAQNYIKDEQPAPPEKREPATMKATGPL